MPKKQSSETNQGLTSRGVLLVVGITALLAIIIIVVFTFFFKQDNTDREDYQKYLNELRQQSNVPKKESNEVKEEEIVRRTVRGVLTEIRTDSLVVTVRDSNEKAEVFLRNDTVITYQNQTFDRSRFFVGDQLEIIAREDLEGLTAETVTVIISASPATPVPVPITPNVSPEGSFRPLGVE